MCNKIKQIQSVVREGWCVLEKVYMFFKVRESLRASETERGKRERVCERQKTNCVCLCVRERESEREIVCMCV